MGVPGNGRTGASLHENPLNLQHLGALSAPLKTVISPWTRRWRRQTRSPGDVKKPGKAGSARREATGAERVAKVFSKAPSSASGLKETLIHSTPPAAQGGAITNGGRTLIM